MFHSPVLDVVVGLSFTYAMLSLVCTVLNEWIVAVTHLRARSLHRAVLGLLDDPRTGLGTAFYRHPAVQSLAVAGCGRPAYLPPPLVGQVLADLLVGADPSQESWRRAVYALPPCRLRGTLVFLLAGATPEGAPDLLAAWFEDAMRPLSAWYKGRLQWITCAVALVVCVALNADALRLVHLLWGVPTAAPAPLRISGCLFSAMAVSRGAPFWFDALNRVSQARQPRD